MDQRIVNTKMLKAMKMNGSVKVYDLLDLFPCECFNCSLNFTSFMY